MQNQITLSIGVFSFNHQKWLTGVIQGILDQQCQYPFEIIILDDASTDGSQAIINDCVAKHPDVIRSVINVKNQGPVLQAKQFLNLALGKYLCWLDADDCWTYKHKLLHQIDFLEHHPDYSGCFHDASIVSEAPHNSSGDEYVMRFHDQWRSYSQFNVYKADFFPWDALMRKIIPTASLVFRKTEMGPFFEKFNGQKLSISWAAHLWILKSGKFRYFNEVWSEYRDHPEGFSKKHSLIDFKVNNIKILELYLEDEYYCHLKKDVYKALVQEYFHLLSLPDIGKTSAENFNNYVNAHKKYSKLAFKAEHEYFLKNYKEKN